ncbi:BTAD domain-containing putative transcriptional regulator [Micromonospora vulcania]|uniref:BTAD domain-containing putative transcriptional regulator n=1 Tax=Micromonospora vulcania TaxID=1441873 RepID=A0ABW1H087_9ACTN
MLSAGLDLWRGPAYAEFVAEPWAQAEVTRLEELRLAARELLLDVTLRCGDAAKAVAEAEVLTRQAPLREESWRLLALGWLRVLGGGHDRLPDVAAEMDPGPVV